MANTKPIVVEIPDDYAKGIGRVLVQWSYVEWKLRQVSYRLLGLDPKRGRVAVRDPRGEEFMTMFEQLARLAKIELDKKRLRDLGNDLRLAKTERDLVAHSIWLREEPEKYLVLRIGGNWDPNEHGTRISKRELPEGVEVTLEGLDKIREFIAVIAEDVDLLDREIAQKLSTKGA
jgi:hypothetical protein